MCVRVYPSPFLSLSASAHPAGGAPLSRPFALPSAALLFTYMCVCVCVLGLGALPTHPSCCGHAHTSAATEEGREKS